MLGCYVGPVGIAARGVPERFTNPDAEPPRGEGDSGEAVDGAADTADMADTAPSTPGPGAGSAAPAPAEVVGVGDAMDVDKA